MANLYYVLTDREDVPAGLPAGANLQPYQHDTLYAERWDKGSATGFAKGQAVRPDGSGGWLLALAAVGQAALGIVLSIESANVAWIGTIRGQRHKWTAHGLGVGFHWLSDTLAGGYRSTAPTHPVKQRLLFVDGADHVRWLCEPEVVV